MVLAGVLRGRLAGEAAGGGSRNRLRKQRRSLLALGDTNFRLNDPGTAAACFAECLALTEDVAKQYPKALNVKQELGRGYALAGDFYLRSGDLAKARPLFDRSLALALELTRVDPKQVTYQWDLGHAHYRLGLLALRTGDAAGAKRSFEACLAVREHLARQDKVNDRRQMEHMLALAHCGKAEQAEAIARRLLRGKPDPELLLDVARCFCWCGKVAEAVEAMRQAVAMGYRDLVYLEREPDLDPLRADPAFGQLLETLRKQ